MTNDRRRFVTAAMATAVPLLVPLSARALSLDAEPLTVSSTSDCQLAFTSPFDQLIGEVFELNTNNGVSTRARLMHVDARQMNCDAHPRPSHLRSETTIIRFETGATKKLDDAIYRVRHAQLQSVDLFLTATPDSTGRMVLEAVIN